MASGNRHREVEAKFAAKSAADARRIVEALGVPKGAKGAVADVDDVYWDTEDGALLRAGFGFRVRKKPGGAIEATLKSLGEFGGGGVVSRDEWTAPISTAHADARLLPAGEPRATIVAVAGERPLRALARVQGRRTTWRVAAAPGLEVEVASDRGTATCRGKRVPVAEVEAELLAGDPDAFAAFARRAAKSAGAVPSKGSKLLRALAAAGVRPPRPAEVASARLAIGPAAGPTTPAGKAFAREASRLAEALRTALRGARRGTVEGVHDLRTTTRRLRALTKAHRDELPEGAEDDLGARLRALRRSAGEVRDLDVLAEALRGKAARRAEPDGLAVLRRLVAQRRAAARGRLSRALSGPRAESVADRIVEAAGAASRRASPPLAVVGACRLPGEVEEALARRAARSEGLSDAPAPALHALRVALKRARYAAEAFAPAFGGPVRRFARAARDAQDGLGAVQDAVVQGDAVRGLLKDVSPAAAGSAAAARAAASVADGLDRTARKARERAADLVEAALGERSLRALGEHLMKRAAAAAARASRP